MAVFYSKSHRLSIGVPLSLKPWFSGSLSLAGGGYLKKEQLYFSPRRAKIPKLKSSRSDTIFGGRILVSDTTVQDVGFKNPTYDAARE